MTVLQRRVLIVEDEVILAFDLSDAVEEMGYAVLGPALSLAEGLRLAEEEAIDCALLDVNLGGELTSRSIADRLRDKGVKLAFVSAYSRHQIEFLHHDESVFGKPLSRSTLTSILADLCQ